MRRIALVLAAAVASGCGAGAASPTPSPRAASAGAASAAAVTTRTPFAAASWDHACGAAPMPGDTLEDNWVVFDPSASDLAALAWRRTPVRAGEIVVGAHPAADFAVSPDGRFVAGFDTSTSEEPHGFLFDLEEKRELSWIRDLTAKVRSVALGSSTALLEIGKYTEEDVLLVETVSGRVIERREVGGVGSIAISADGRRYAVERDDGRVAVFDRGVAEPRTSIVTGERRIQMAMARDGSKLVIAHSNPAGTDAIEVHDAETGKVERKFRALGWVRGMAVGDAGRKIAVVGDHSNDVLLVEGDKTRTVAVGVASFGLYGVAFDAREEQLIVGAAYEVARGRLDARSLTTAAGGARALAFTPGGATVELAMERGMLVRRRRPDGSVDELFPYAEPYAASFSPDGKTLVVHDGSNVHWYETETAKPLGGVLGHRLHTAMARGDELLVVGEDGERLYGTRDGRFVRIASRAANPGFTTRVLAPGIHASVLDVGRDDELHLSVRLDVDGTERRLLEAPARIAGLAGDGRLVAVAADALLLGTICEDTPPRKVSAPGLRVFYDSKIVVGARHALVETAGLLQVVDLESGTIVRSVADGSRGVLSGDGSKLAFVGTGDEDHVSKVVDVRSGKEIFRDENRSAPLAFDPSGARLALATDDWTIRIVPMPP
jgi:hypothetical protein